MKKYGWIFSFLLITPMAKANKLLADSGTKKVTLVELYSSESCSSCPPADEWISGLKNKTGLWSSFVPVVFHVDYWNDLGWKDGLSANSMTRRQKDVAQTWTKPLLYTPAVVVAGKEWRNWSSEETPPIVSEKSSVELKLFAQSATDFEVLVQGLQSSSSEQYVLRWARLGMDISTNVTSGENSGRVLKHNFAVLDWGFQEIDLKNPKIIFSSKDVKKIPHTALAVWIEKLGQPIAIQATGAYL